MSSHPQPDAFMFAEARLLRSVEHGRSWRGSRTPPAEIRSGALAELLTHLRTEDTEDLYKFAIVTADGHYIRNAELRALLYPNGVPAE